MEITYDPAKRVLIQDARGLDFEDAVHVFAGPALTVADDRRDYGEERYQTLGLLNGRLVLIVWTPRGETRHIITMWKANDRDRKRYEAQFG
jgi:hypothetical protein